MKEFFIWVSISLFIDIQLPRSNKKKSMKINKGTSLLKILTQLNIKPDTCLTLINNAPVPIDSIINEGETLTLIEVTSGG